MYYIILILMVGAGLICLKYTMWVVKTFGHVAWSERLLGPGSSYAFWRLLGAFLIMGSFFVLRYGHALGL